LWDERNWKLGQSGREDDPVNKSEIIRQRRSVRTFDGNALRTEDAQQILEFARRVENPYDLPVTWKLLNARRDGLSSPVITGTDTFIAGKLRRAEHAEEAFGYTFEKVLLFACSLGVGSTWIAGTMDRAAFERAMALEEGEVMPCVSPLGYPAKKMSLRETMMRRGIKADSRLDFGALFFEGSFETPLTPERAGDLALPLELVRLAPSAVNRQPWRLVTGEGRVHFYEKRSRSGSVAGWDVQKVDLGIAMCHFELGAQERGLRTAFVTEDPGIPAGDAEYIATCVFQ